MGAIALSQVDGNEYSVQASFGNTGNVHLYPTCSGAITNIGGTTTVVRFQTRREPGLLLPLGLARFNGTVDFDGVQPGIYNVEMTVQYGSEAKKGTLPVRVSDGPEGKIVEVIVLEEKKAADAGADAETYDRVTGDYRQHEWSPTERLVPDFAAKVACNAYKITADDARAFRDAGLDDEAYVDVYCTVATQLGVDRIANGLGVAADTTPLLPTRA